ncbi:MAG: tetratricopeptide repeat protein [Burkholderiales bacterium]|nr:tetratricopeptide repeat protein [Anaerolineae bacterium]
MNTDLLRVAGAYIQAGELDDALATLHDYLDTHTEDDDAVRLRAAVLLRLGSADNLYAALDDLVRLPTLGSDDYYQQSVIYERLGELNGAAHALMQAHAIAPDDERLTERYLGILVALGRVDDARTLAESMPRTWRWLRWRGDLAAQAGDHTAAVEQHGEALDGLNAALETMETAFTSNIKAQILLARAHALTALERYNEADADYAAAETLTPDDLMIQFNRGLVAALRGDIATAIGLCGDALQRANAAIEEHMRKALSEDPRFAALAMLLLEGE